MAFLEACDALGIILVILPPHATQNLQPLDVSCFCPLSQKYTKQLNRVVFNSLGAMKLSKRSFWGIFLPAWEEAMSPANVQSGWRRTGLFPWDPELVIGSVRRPAVKTEVQAPVQKTPMTSKALRRFEKEFKRYPTREHVNQACRILFKLEARNAITQHVNEGLKATLGIEKMRRKRGKRLNLIGEEAKGTQIYDTKAVAVARERLQQKQVEEEA
jgi:hypothetical protein